MIPEWDKAESFHAFFPASEGFAAFAADIMPFSAAKPVPQLFEPGVGYDRSNSIVESGIAQILVGKIGEKRDGVSSAWDQLVESLSKEGDVKTWIGFGIDNAEGTWAGLLGWDSVEVCACL